MKLSDFPRCKNDDKEKLDLLYDWCYELYLYIKGEMKNDKTASESAVED